MSHTKISFAKYRRDERKLRIMQKQVEILDAALNEVDESEVDELRLRARDKNTRDEMSDDSAAFHAMIRDYHVYRDARTLR